MQSMNNSQKTKSIIPSKNKSYNQPPSMNFNEEDSIIPILNQVKTFQSRWVAKNKQCEILESFLKAADDKNRELETNNTELKSTLNALIAKNKEIKATNTSLKSSLKETRDKNKELTVKCESLKSSLEAANAKNGELCTTLGTTESSLIFANVRIEELRVKCDALKSALETTNAKYEKLRSTQGTSESSLISANVRIKELDSKYTALESLLHKVDYENKDRKMKLDKLNKEITEEKKKLVMVTLEKIQNKLLSSPMHAVIDRVKSNIEVLDEIARNSVFVPRQKDVEIVDIASSDEEDDASTLSFVSEKQNVDEDPNQLSRISVNDKTKPFGQSSTSSEITEQNSASSSMPTEDPTVAVATPCAARSCVEDTDRNRSRGNQLEVSDDINYDSDISLSVCDDVTSTTVEEESLNSFGKLLVSLTTSSLESSSSTCTSTIVNNHTSATKKPETEKRVQPNDPIASPASYDERNIDENNKSLSAVNNEDPNTDQVPASVKVPEINSASVPEPVISPSNQSKNLDSNKKALSNQNQNKNILDCHVFDDQVKSVVAKLLEKHGDNVKIMHRVALTPIQDRSYDRVDVNVGKSIESSFFSVPSIAESTAAHSQRKHIQYSCRTCNKSFLSVYSLDSHIKLDHHCFCIACQLGNFSAQNRVRETLCHHITNTHPSSPSSRS